VAIIKNGKKEGIPLNEVGEPIVKNGKLKLGDLEAKRDWGYAKDYVKAMWLMLQQEKPDDYIICTGVEHSIKEFLMEAFISAGLGSWKKFVKQNPLYTRPAELHILKGDCSKARKKLGWKPYHNISFEKMVEVMVKADIKRLKK